MLSALAAPAAFAQRAFTAGVTVQQSSGSDTVAFALGPNGQVAVGVPDGFNFPQQYLNYVSGANGGGVLTSVGPTQSASAFGTGSVDAQTGGFAYYSPEGTLQVAAVTNSAIAVNINNYVSGFDDNGYAGIGQSGAILNTATGTISYTGNGTAIAGMNAAGAVAGTVQSFAGGYLPSTDTAGPGAGTLVYGAFNPPGVGPNVPDQFDPFYEAPGAPKEATNISSTALGTTISLGTPTVLATLGFGGSSSAINASGQVTGTDFTNTFTTSCQALGSIRICSATQNTEAFVTAANGGTVSFLGVGDGVSSTANAINDKGQVGGYVTLASGQTQAFITNADGSFDYLSAPGDATADSTEITYLNSSGEAILEDATTQTFYLYDASNGSIDPLTSLFGSANLAGFTLTNVLGLNNAGQILLQVSNSSIDPAMLLSPVIPNPPESGDLPGDSSGQTPVPEPMSLALLTLGFGLSFASRKSARQRTHSF